MSIPPLLGAVAFLACASTTAFADTRRVPADYSSIQQAVDFSVPGDVVLVASGSYLETVTVAGKTGIEIRGKGWPVFPGPASGLVVSGGSSGILVRGFEFAGATATVQDSADVTLARNRFRDWTISISVSNMNGIVVTGCEFRDIAGDAIVDAHSTGLVVEKCRFETIQFHAVFLTNNAEPSSDGAVLSRNRVTGAAVGFSIAGTGILVDRNRLEGIAAQGILASGSADTTGATLSRNRIESAGVRGIETNSWNAVIERNTLAGGGIRVTGTWNTITGNTVRGPHAEGILIDGSSVVSRNRVMDASTDGIRVQNGGSNLDRNVVDGTTGHGIAVLAGPGRLDRNRVIRAGLDGFFVDAADITLTRNQARGSGGFDLRDTRPLGTNSYELNVFGTTDFP